VLVEVPGRRRAPELLAQLAEQTNELVGPGKASWDEACLPLRVVPAPEVLDDRLWVDRRLGVLLELAHGRRAPESLRGALKLLENLLVRVTLADPRLELGQRFGIDTSQRR